MKINSLSDIAASTLRRRGGRGRIQVTLFPGASIFCRQYGCSHSHLYRVLLGERTSAKIVSEFAAWLSANGLPWPTEAKISPLKTEAGQCPAPAA